MNGVFLTMALLTLQTNAFMSKFKDMYVTDFHITKCYPNETGAIAVEDVEINIGPNMKVHVSGTLIASRDLASPIKTEVVVKKSTWFGWFGVGCVDNVGSCNFEDLCEFGYQPAEGCPPDFKEYNVPCRCPLKKGNYRIPSTILDFMSESLVLGGKYKGSVVMTHLDERLACYNMYFTLTDKEL
ncbi:hypothetical protein PPYR_07595 [Photinus pyralis]|uniref:MD-2-related lipid-recognition domain-containing protein n=3 Tax=Photinus pyralis TaxID=7054 RepID=A0A5N4AQT1_PHOPY|nr:ganglioside GM2 activator-like [Photinus pyralis]KAB0799715.1 hypothetical protein PPYR_07595 [Photinus pyralis]